MNYLPGYPVKRPKKKEADSSGTEGTQKSSMGFGSRVTPNFHVMSDDDFFETPKRQKPQKDQHSTQQLMAQLIFKNQNDLNNNGIFGSFVSFNGGQKTQGFNRFFKMFPDDPGENQFNQLEQTIASDGFFTFNEENQFENHKFSNFPQKNWSGTVLLKNEPRADRQFYFVQEQNLKLNQKNQEQKKDPIFNSVLRQSLIQDYQTNNGLTIFEVKEELEGLTNPIDGGSQPNSQNVMKNNLENLNQKFQSAKKSLTENEKLRQSIIEVLSNMDLNQSDSNKKKQENQPFRIKEKNEDQEDKDTIIDDLSDLVLSPSRDKSQPKLEKVIEPIVGSERKGGPQIKFKQFGPNYSIKTNFQLRKKNQQNIEIVNTKNIEEPPNQSYKRQSFLQKKINQNSPNKQIKKLPKKVVKQKDHQQDYNSQKPSTHFIESKVAQINLDSLQQLGLDLPSQKKNNLFNRKSENHKSFFKNKPYDALNQKRERKNNLMNQQGLKNQKIQLQKQKSSRRRQIFTGFSPSIKKKVQQIEDIDYFHSNPLPIEQGQSQFLHTKPFEHQSETIDPFCESQTYPIEFQNLQQPVLKMGIFRKNKGLINPTKAKDQIKTEKKSVDLKEALKKPLTSMISQTKPSSEQNVNQQKQYSSKGDLDRLSTRSNKFVFKKRQNQNRPLKCEKTEPKQQIPAQKNWKDEKIEKYIQKKPLEKIVFKFQRRKDKQSKNSKLSLNSINSEQSSMGPDMKGIFQKVNAQKINPRKTNFKENNSTKVIQEQKFKYNFDFKNRNNSGFKLSQVKEKKQVIRSQIQPTKNSNEQNSKHKFNFENFIKRQSRSNQLIHSSKIQSGKQDVTFQRTFTVEKQKNQPHLTIPKYIFSKKTPPKNSQNSSKEDDKKIKQIFSNLKNSVVEQKNSQNPKNIFDSRKKISVQVVTRSNFMITRQKEGYKEETESQKMRYRYGQDRSSNFPSIESNSNHSNLIKEVQELIELVAVAKIKMRKRRENSEEFLQKTIELKKTVDELFPQQRIKKLMDWKYV